MPELQDETERPERNSRTPKSRGWRAMLRAARPWLAAVALGGVGAALLLWALLRPVPYVIHSAGPTVDVLGTQQGVPVLEFAQSGGGDVAAQRDPVSSDGQLRMVTVSEMGGPGYTARGIDLVRAWFEPGTQIFKFSDLYDPSVTAEDVQASSAAQMTSSHSSSAIAAMDYLGMPIVSTLTVVDAVPDTDAVGKVRPGDVLVSITTPDGTVHPVDRPSVPFTVMKQVPPGSTVLLEIERGGARLTEPIVSSASDPSSPGSKMGIFLDADTRLPMDVAIHLERIGGPSAGLIFALGIVDQLTEGGITGGEVIAGTGALSFAGDVMPIGGIRQKMQGAVRDGAHWFLAPQDNCDEVVGYTPRDLTVVPVATLAEAAAYVDEIADGDTSSLPTCEALVGAH